MAEQTLDPCVEIMGRSVNDDGAPVVHYRRIGSGEEWAVAGVCNQCGLCVIGAADSDNYEWHAPPGTPGAVRDLRFGARLDEPVTPSFFPSMRKMAAVTETATVEGCSLSLVEG